MKKQNIINLLLLTLISIFFTACGGGVSSSGSASSVNVNANGFTGMFIDSPVSGLDYKCDGEIKKTDSSGLFNCKSTPVDFYLGNLKLGSIGKITDDYLVFPQDILDQPRSAALYPEVTKMVILLQSLDSDGDASNGIDIKQNTLALLNQQVSQGTDIQNITLADLTSLIETIIKNDTVNQSHLVTIQQAQDHLLLSVSSTYESPIQP